MDRKGGQHVRTSVALNFRRSVAAALIVAAYAPLYRLLDPARTGPAGVATRAAAETAWLGGLYGTGVVVGIAIVMSLLVPGERVSDVAQRLARFLERPGSRTFALAVATLAFFLATAVALVLFGGLPTSVDEMAQLLHAQALSSGALGIPMVGPEAAWTVQNGIVTAEGWVSVYPPFHTLMLALGLAIGAPWIVGPVAVGVATAFATLSFERLLGVRLGRASGALLSITPFWLLLGGTHLSHTTAAACLALVLWTGLKARDGHVGWAGAAGAAVGAAVCTRPWIGLVCSAVLLGLVWLPRAVQNRSELERWGIRVGAALVGGVPFAALFAWWNTRLFGNPFRLGYVAAFGPAHQLGFHVDPWGNRYGPLEAIGYTGADLGQLGAHLLESPLPAVAVIGIGVLWARRDATPAVLLGWVLASLGANALYWHHGIHMGPRMLYETTPAWIALFVTGASAITRKSSSTSIDRGVAAWSVAIMLLVSAFVLPGTLRARADATGGLEAHIPTGGLSGQALIFVHGSWASRIAARLTEAGMRRDSVETALRRNDICALDLYARWRALEERPSTPPPIDFEPLPGSPATLETRLLSPGNPARIAPDGPRDLACAREARADRYGAIELEPLLWQAPPLPGRDVVMVRDLGPAGNALIREAIDGPALVYVAGSGDGEPQLLDYADGMELLWRGAAGGAR